MAEHMRRRTFIRHISAAGLGLPAGAGAVMPRLVRAGSANERVNIAGIGVGGKGWGDINLVSKGQNVAAICDVDEGPDYLGRAAEKFPKARRYTDWRRLLDEADDIDAVTVSTPDHMHAPIIMTALSQGLHVYGQKPMTHDLYEARQVVNATRRAGVVTQLGTQHHSTIGMRMLVQVIRDGAIGKIKEAHTWSDIPGSFWPIGRKPPKTGNAPERLHWDLWLGTGPERAFAKDLYHPRAWRAWTDFGSGGVGDNGSHILDPVMWSLGLGVPASVQAESPGTNGYTYTPWSVITWDFPGSRHTAHDRIKVTWHDGGRKPSRDLIPLPKGRNLPRHGNIFIGTEGAILFSIPPSAPQLLPAEKFADYEYPKLEGRDHYMQWTNAIRGETRTTCPFTSCGALTEAILLGNIAIRLPGETLKWDSENLRFPNSQKANGMVRREYRKGWEVPGLS